jgi:aspartate aminotransferase-like enzyme
MDGRNILMTPGPTEVSMEVIAAMIRPAIAHYDPAFNEGTLVETLEMLQRILQTKNEVLIFPGSGRVALESSIVSVVEKGDRVLTITAGVFGCMMKEMVERAGGETVELSVKWGQQINLDRLNEMLRRQDFRALTMVHNESTTGAVYPLRPVSDLLKGTDTLFMVDTVSSLGGMNIETDQLGIDFNMSASHKCLGTPPGIGIVSVSEKGWRAMKKRKKPCCSFSYDLLRWREMWIPKERGGKLMFGWRRQPITMPTHSVYALQKACEMVLEEGLEKRAKRHNRAANALREGVKALGLGIFPEHDLASSTLTAVKFPEHISASGVKNELLRRYNIMVGGGIEALRDRIIRIGHMNLTASLKFVLPTIQGLGLCLRKGDRERGIDLGLATEMAEKAYGQ